MSRNVSNISFYSKSSLNNNLSISIGYKIPSTIKNKSLTKQANKTKVFF